MSLSSLLFRQGRRRDLAMHLSPQPPLSIGIPQAHLLGLKTTPTDPLLPSSAQEEEREEEEEEEEEEEFDEEKDEEDEERCCWASYGRRSGMKRLHPPITVVAKAGEKKCLMAWVLQRSYEDGGRLVMREVEVKHQEYLKASRKKGRLILTVVHVEPPPENPSWPSILSSMVAISSPHGPLFKALPAREKESDGGEKGRGRGQMNEGMPRLTQCN